MAKASQASLLLIDDTRRDAAETQIREKLKITDCDIREYPIDVIVSKFTKGRDTEQSELYIPDVGTTGRRGSMPREPLLYAFTLIQNSLVNYNPHKPWPSAMEELQRFVFDEHPELVPQSLALQWAKKATRPWPTCDNWREPERLEALKMAAELAGREGPSL